MAKEDRNDQQHDDEIHLVFYEKTDFCHVHNDHFLPMTPGTSPTPLERDAANIDQSQGRGVNPINFRNPSLEPQRKKAFQGLALGNLGPKLP